MHLSVVIPTLNEAARLPRTLAALEALDGMDEIVVADGGSTDDTVHIAGERASVVRARRGRARQMNAGAAQARGDVLIFLHADTRLPAGAADAIRDACAGGAEAGAFRLAFDRDGALLRFYAACTHLPLPSICFGDRALFVRRSAFDALGGFADIPVFEDLDLVRRLHARGGFCFLPQAVTTSARRFDANGQLRQQLLNTSLWLRYQLGTSPEHLAASYGYTPDVRG